MNTPKAKIVVVLGAGGVGKTTTAASLALAFAHRGLRSVVITVDPALRLAQALGLASLSNEPREVASYPNGGTLSALWLDARTAFDELVRRYATTPESAEKILGNRLFRIVQGQLGGVEEYLGVEKVLGLGRSGDYDICILDTPPSRHALDFLESPRHLIRFFDESVLKTFIQGDQEENQGTGFFSRILRSGKHQAVETFKNFLGRGFLAELGELLSNLKPVHKVFTETAEGIEQWVHSKDCRFVGVSLLEPYPLDEVRLLSLELASRGLPEPQLLVLNKCLPTDAPPAIEILRDALGPDAAKGIIERHELQKKLRARLHEDHKGSLAFAELLRYSGKDLDRQRLLEMGRNIFESWESKDPDLFSKL